MGVWRDTIAAAPATTLGSNLVLNPIFVTDTAGWDLAFGTDTATRVSNGASNGDWYVQGTEGKADSGLSQLPADMEPVTPGGMVLMGTDVKVNNNAAQFKLWMGFAEYNAAQTFLAWNPFIALSESFSQRRKAFWSLAIPFLCKSSMIVRGIVAT